MLKYAIRIFQAALEAGERRADLDSFVTALLMVADSDRRLDREAMRVTGALLREGIVRLDTEMIENIFWSAAPEHRWMTLVELPLGDLPPTQFRRFFDELLACATTDEHLLDALGHLRIHIRETDQVEQYGDVVLSFIEHPNKDVRFQARAIAKHAGFQ